MRSNGDFIAFFRGNILGLFEVRIDILVHFKTAALYFLVLNEQNTHRTRLYVMVCCVCVFVSVHVPGCRCVHVCFVVPSVHCLVSLVFFSFACLVFSFVHLNHAIRISSCCCCLPYKIDVFFYVCMSIWSVGCACRVCV